MDSEQEVGFDERLPFIILPLRTTALEYLDLLADKIPWARLHLATRAARRACENLRAAYTLHERITRTRNRALGDETQSGTIFPDCVACGESTSSWCDTCDRALCTACDDEGCTSELCELFDTGGEQESMPAY